MLDVEGINYAYVRKIKILRNINFMLTEGEFVCLAGVNGCGKTTLIKLIVDLLKIQSGSITMNGEKHTYFEAKKKIVYLPSEDCLPEFLTGREYIILLCNLYGKKFNNEKLAKIAEYYSLTPKLDELIEDYSHGMKKKVQLTSAFLIKPSLIVIDETLNGIDIEAKEVTKLLINNYTLKGGTVLLTTHDLDLVEEIGERLLLMHEGEIKIDACISSLEGSLNGTFKKLIGYERLEHEIKANL